MYNALKSIFFLVYPFLWKNKTARLVTSGTFGLILLDTLNHAATPRLLGYLLQQYQKLTTPSLYLIVICLLISWYAGGALSHLRSIAFFSVVNHAIRAIRMRVVVQLHQVPIQCWEKYGITEILSASTRISQSLRDFMNISFINVLPACINIGVCSIAMWQVHRSTWYFTPLALLSYGYAYMSIRDFLALRQRCWEATDQAHTAMTDSLYNTKWYRFHLKEEKKRLAVFFDTEEQYWLHNNFLRHKTPLVQVTWFTIVRGGLIIHLVYLLRSNVLGWADFIVIERYIALLYKQITIITNQLQRLLGSVIDFKKILDLLALPTYTASSSLHASQQLHPTRIPGTPVLQACDVSFTYAPQGQNILQGCSLRVHLGEKVAITGPAGIGKSTLCHLLAGIYQPQQGEIRLWGISLKKLPLDVIGQHIHLADQDATLISDPATVDAVTTNSMYTMAELRSKAPHPIGKKLSGGEQQRMLLARYLRYQPEVLILDETLNALDEASAQALLQHVLNTVPTVILVTHRLSLVQGFQYTYRLENGKLKVV